MLLVAVAAAVVLPADQSFDVLAAVALLVLLVAGLVVRVPVGNGWITGVQPVFVAALVLEPARTVALLVLVANLCAELIEVATHRRALRRLPMACGHCWFAVPPTVIVALAPSPVPWQWWAAAFVSQFAVDAVTGHVRDLMGGSPPTPWMVRLIPELLDVVLTLPVLFACLQARGQAAAWVVPASLVAMGALLGRERSGRVTSEQAAGEDPLTGLPNRRLFEQLLGGAQARAERANRDAAVVVVDLDQFKEVNDTLGHDVGDEVLREAARRLRSVVRAGDVVARPGGDEFALLLDDGDGAGRVATAIEAAFAEPVRVGAHRCAIGASVGWAVFGPLTPAAEAVQRADDAMYAHKRCGGHGRGWRVGDTSPHAETRRPVHD